MRLLYLKKNESFSEPSSAAPYSQNGADKLALPESGSFAIPVPGKLNVNFPIIKAIMSIFNRHALMLSTVV